MSNVVPLYYLRLFLARKLHEQLRILFQCGLTLFLRNLLARRSYAVGKLIVSKKSRRTPSLNVFGWGKTQRLSKFRHGENALLISMMKSLLASFLGAIISDPDVSE